VVSIRECPTGSKAFNLWDKGQDLALGDVGAVLAAGHACRRIFRGCVGLSYDRGIRPRAVAHVLSGAEMCWNNCCSLGLVEPPQRPRPDRGKKSKDTIKVKSKTLHQSQA
jgi:hypothetical protein